MGWRNNLLIVTGVLSAPLVGACGAAPDRTSTLRPAAVTSGAVPPCTTSQLSVALSRPSGTAGTVYYSLVFTNHGTAPCGLSGYPRVSFATGPDHRQVGAAAQPDSGAAPSFLLAPGQAADATLGVVDPYDYGPPCGLTQVDALQVSPPGDRPPVLVPDDFATCAARGFVTLHVGPVRPSS